MGICKMKKNICSQCTGLAYIKGYCYKHYQLNKYYERKRRFGDVWNQQRTRICGSVTINTRNNGGYISYNNVMYHITPLQILWLHSRGGRTIDDVEVINGELGVMMREGNRDVFVGIPNDRFIKQEYNIKPAFPKSDRLVLMCKK
jgi:uncharacterized protein Usg